MSNYINTTFSCNEYYLLAQLLTHSNQLKELLNGQNPELQERLTPLEQGEKEKLATEFGDFMGHAENMPEIQDLLKFEDDFDKVPDEQKGAFNDKMFERLERISQGDTSQAISQYENSSVIKAFDLLRDTSFFKSALGMAKRHKETLQKKLEAKREKAEESIKPILEGLPEKEMDIVVLPPELFDTQVALNTQGDKVKSAASYPAYFDRDIQNTSTVSMLHEMMHTYIPLDKDRKFENPTQELVYDVINHGLVELASNCELGMAISDLESYFQIPMHNEILKHNFMDRKGIKASDFEKSGIKFPEGFDGFSFGSKTKFDHGNGIEEVVTEKDELSNDKIRGIIYPYFLAFKNRASQDPTKAIMEEMQRDANILEEMYGPGFYELITDENFIHQAIDSMSDVDNILQLNDMIAERVFGIEREQTRETLEKETEEPEKRQERTMFTTDDLGKWSINASTQDKDESKDRMSSDERQIQEILQEQGEK